MDNRQEFPQSPIIILRDIFPGISNETIADIVGMVEEGNPNDTFEGKLENMINLLSADGAWGGPIPENVFVSAPPIDDVTLNSYYENLVQVFPDASPDYLWKFCKGRQAGFTLDQAIEELTQYGYDKIEVDPLVIWEQLKGALPDADPLYLKHQARRLAELDRQDMDDFLQNVIEQGDYPTMQDYLKQKKEHDDLAIYKNQFNVDKFLEVIPNPVQFYADPQRKRPLDENANEDDVKYALYFLYSHYNFIRKKYIDQLFLWKNKNLVEVCERLDRMSKNMRRPRRPEEEVETKNVALLQEIAYLKNRKLIKRVLKLKDDHYRFAKEEARKYNLLEECQCCFDDELIPEECYFCMKGCIFCKDCVKAGVETVIGKAEYRFLCFANCDSEFSLQTLQMVLPQRIFERVVQKIASEEIKKANVEGLETCPFCDFAMILPANEKIFKCINADCLIESCRECRHKSHIPLRCNEIEYDEDVRMRTYIENKMTEALTRTCYSCKKVFIKTHGCNKMTCTCGAKMCYLCGAAIKDYSHFGEGRCALFTNDVALNLQRIVESATRAKDELGNVTIKFDPTVNIENFYPA